MNVTVCTPESESGRRAAPRPGLHPVTRAANLIEWTLMSAVPYAALLGWVLWVSP